MSTNNTENLGFKIITMGRDEYDSRKPCNLNPLTLAKLHAWIDTKQIDPNLKIELKKSASTYPQQALARWQKTYNKQLSIIQKKIKNKTLEENLKSLDLKNIVDINDALLNLEVKKTIDDNFDLKESDDALFEVKNEDINEDI